MDVSLAQQYGPLFAACVALVGVLVTLVVTGRREAARHRLVRQDEYRREQRTAIAGVATGAHAFRRAGGAVAVPGALDEAGRDAALGMLDAADRAGADLLNALTIARLLVNDGGLQDTIDGLYVAWARTSECLADVAGSHRAADRSGTDNASIALAPSLGGLDRAGSIVQSVALEVLLPTVVESTQRGRRRPGRCRCGGSWAACSRCS